EEQRSDRPDEPAESGDLLPWRDVEEDEDEPREEGRAAPEPGLARRELEDRREDDEDEEGDDQRGQAATERTPCDLARRRRQEPGFELVRLLANGVEQPDAPAHGRHYP